MLARLDDPAGPAVDEVRDRTHANQFALAFENVHQARSVKCRLHRVLPRDAEGRVPFVESHPDFAIRDNLADLIPDLAVKALVPQGSRHQGPEARRIVRLRAVVVDRQHIDLAADRFQHGAVPLQILVADCNEADLGIDLLHGANVTAGIARVRGGVRVSAHPVAPNLVADFPVLHAERLGMAIASAQLAEWRVGWTVHVFDPCRGLFSGCRARRSSNVLPRRSQSQRFDDRRAASLDIHDDVGFGTYQLAEFQVFERAEVRGLRIVVPRHVHPERPLVTRADPPLPVVVLRDIASRPAHERRAQGSDLGHYVRSQPSLSIAGHQGHLIDPNRTCANDGQDEPSPRIGHLRRQLEIEPLPVTGDPANYSAGVSVSARSILFQRDS